MHEQWKMKDRLIWEIAFGDLDTIKHHVSKAELFCAQRKLTVLVYADQMPFWIKIGSRKALFAAWEVQTKGKLAMQTLDPHQRSFAGRSEARRASRAKLACAEQIDEMIRVQQAENVKSQKRDCTNVDEDKARVCFQPRQAVLNYFDSSQFPVGKILPSLLVLQAPHNRLSNIDNQGRYIKAQTFYVAGKEVKHVPTRLCSSNVVRQYVELRNKFPELFTKLVVMFSPSACVDEVIYCWDLEDLSNRFPQMLETRDLMGAPATPTSKIAKRAVSCIAAWISPGMTPCGQLTDTDLAFPAQAGARRKKTEIMSRQRDAHLSSNPSESGTYRCTAQDMMEIAIAAHDAMVRLNEVDDIVLKGLRRNGEFAWRPDLERNRLVRSDTQAWAVGKPEGSHRLRPDWFVDRYSWLDVEGRPQREQLEKMSLKKKTVEEMLHTDSPIVASEFLSDYQVTRAGQQITIPVVALDFDGADLFEQELLTDISFKTPRQRRLDRRAAFQKDVVEFKKSRRSTSKIQSIMKDLGKEWKAAVDEDLRKRTVEEVLAALLPSAGKCRSSNPLPKPSRLPGSHLRKMKALRRNQSLKGKAHFAKMLARRKAAKGSKAAKPAQAAEAPAADAPAPPAPDPLLQHHFVGQVVRVVDEQVLEAFGLTSKITAACADGKFMIKSDDDPRSFKVAEDQFEFLHLLAARLPMKRLQLNSLDRGIMLQTFPDVCNHHHAEGAWVVLRPSGPFGSIWSSIWSFSLPMELSVGGAPSEALPSLWSSIWSSKWSPMPPYGAPHGAPYAAPCGAPYGAPHGALFRF